MVDERVRLDVPVPPGLSVTLVGLTDAVMPEGETDVVKLTVPANPFRLDRVIVEV